MDKVTQDLNDEERKSPFVMPGVRRLRVDSQLDPACTWETFLEGDDNRIARRAGLAVADKPGSSAFNPLVIYGDSGVGKTHLVQAVGHAVKQRWPTKEVLYVSVERFLSQYRQAERSHELADFIRFYRMMDVLIVDGLRDLPGEPGGQDALLEIGKYLLHHRKQLVFTADELPVHLPGLRADFISWLNTGRQALLALPDYSLRLAIAEQKLRLLDYEMTPDALKYVAYTMSGSIRELEGVLISLSAHLLNGEKADMDLARKVMRHFIEVNNREISISVIEEIVCAYYAVPAKLLRHKTRKREVAQARHVVMYLAKIFTKQSLKSIGDHFGGRDHTTVMHSCQTVKDLMDSDTVFRKQVSDLVEKVKLASM